MRGRLLIAALLVAVGVSINITSSSLIGALAIGAGCGIFGQWLVIRPRRGFSR
jgi:hypothetical protein